MPVHPRTLTQFTQQEIDQLFKRARPVFNRSGLRILIAPSSEGFGKLLVVTPKKVGSAPKRNLLRRRLKSIFYERELFARQFDVIILAKASATALSFGELEAILVGLFERMQSVSHED